MELESIYTGDCRDIISEFPSESIDMIFTSPPYADRRKKSYNSIAVESYVDWFLPIGVELKRLLRPTGSFFLNIKPHVIDGERSLYVFNLVAMLKKSVGFYFVDEFCWTKNAFPGKLKGRFKNAFEPVYHFTKWSPNKIKFNPLACGHKTKEESIQRAYRKQSGDPVNGSGMTALRGKSMQNLEYSRPSNVIHINNVSNQFSDKQKHPATFPEGLVEFFVKSFTDEGDIVLDPFCGSGTVGKVCNNLGRHYILIDIKPEYADLAENRINNNS